MNKFTITPLIRQYKRLKQKEPDAILFFRVSDFYETFYEDAVLTSKTLGIALTQRQEGVPLAGVPHHSAKTYIQRLVSGGHKVAICEQLEEPKPGKLVERDIMEVITQGTVLDDMLLDEKKTNFLASIYPGDNRYGLALLDISTGDFRVTELTRDELLDEIRRLEPKEIIIPEINRFLPDSLSSYKLGNFDGVVEEIEKTIVESPPQTIKEGGIIRSDVNKELDELRNISKNVKLWIADFENTERQRTGIGSLKVGFNSVFGYYIEVTRPNLPKVPEEYIRKQTLANAERFITPQLKEYEAKVLQADERSRLLEYEIFKELRDRLKNFVPSMKEASTKIAYIDVLSILASIARRYGYTRPVVDDEDRIVMKDSRHPVVERLLKEGEFISNDVKLDLDERVLVITGPNMAGKSTYLRQVALCVILAQMGSYIPAMEAMTETANILNNATRRSLLILDEIGRGTSTYDGLSIAWASVEYIVKNTKAKTLFATHYHELTELERLSDEIKNYNLECKKWKDKIIFLRKVVRGGCPQSYGIEVAKLAGLPKDVIERAKRILVSLEREERKGSSERLMQPLQLGIFDEVKESEVEKKLKDKLG